MLNVDAVNDTTELWRTEPGCMVTRDASSFSSSLRVLLRLSRQIILIDPYFDAGQKDKIQPLLAFIECLSPTASIAVHFTDQGNVRPSYDECMRRAANVLPRNLPLGSKVTLRCWRERQGGPRLHNRYIITDVGGVKFGDSIKVENLATGFTYRSWTRLPVPSCGGSMPVILQPSKRVDRRASLKASAASSSQHQTSCVKAARCGAVNILATLAIRTTDLRRLLTWEMPPNDHPQLCHSLRRESD